VAPVAAVARYALVARSHSSRKAPRAETASRVVHQPVDPWLGKAGRECADGFEVGNVEQRVAAVAEQGGGHAPLFAALRLPDCIRSARVGAACSNS